MTNVQLTPDQHRAVREHSATMVWLKQEEARIQAELQHIQTLYVRAQAQLYSYVGQTLHINLMDENWNLDVEKGTLTNGPAE